MKNIFLIQIFLLVSIWSLAQHHTNRRTAQLAFGAQGVQPIGDFSKFYTGVPLGLAGNLSIPLRRSPLEVGASFAWNNMDSKNEDISVLLGQDKQGADIFGSGSMRIRTNTYRYHALARFRPFTGKVQVYVDLIAGLQSFSTTTDVQQDNSGYSSVTNSTTNQRDLTYNVGWATGLRIRLAPAIYVEGRFEKIDGGRARYVDPESIQVDQSNNDLIFDTKESKTNQLTYTVGLAIQF